MSALAITFCFVIYLGVLVIVSKTVSKDSSNAQFFAANKNAPWYLVAFGMIGATLSGVTFISVPGWVGATQLSYIQMVIGYAFGYLLIATILLPLYYKWNVVSIYTYFKHRFGVYSYKTGASFFIISRLTGTSFRLFLVLKVLHWIALDGLNIPFWVSAAAALFGIWLYTRKTGIKTLIYTDTIQTFCMLIALGISFYVLYHELNLNAEIWSVWWGKQPTTQIVFWEDWGSGQHLVKQFLAGVLIAFAMTGMDQEMMQKNISCRTLKASQKNMFWFTIVLVLVTIAFLILGVLLSAYATTNGITVTGDDLFPVIATQSALGPLIGYAFVIGLIAAAFSSADSSMTSLTTSLSVDLWNILDSEDGVKQRKKIHRITAIVLWICVMSFYYLIENESVIAQLLLFAGYTYGPLLGLFLLGIFTKIRLRDQWVPYICLAAPILTFYIAATSIAKFGFDFGFFVLALNGALSGMLLWLSGLGLPVNQSTTPSKTTTESSK